MKAIYKLIHFTAPLAFALVFSIPADALAGAAPAITIPQQEVTLAGGGDDSKGSSDVKAEKTKVNKPKKVKYRRTNHGPRKPIYPQIHRKKEKLSRARYLNAQR